MSHLHSLDIAVIAGYLLATVANFKDRLAYLLAQALDGISGHLAVAARAGTEDVPIPYHPGAAAYHHGQVLPQGDADEAEPHAHPHPHPH